MFVNSEQLGRNEVIAGNGGSGADCEEVKILLEDGKWCIRKWNGSCGNLFGPTANHNLWLHLTSIFTRNTLTIYVNGYLVGVSPAIGDHVIRDVNYNWQIGGIRKTGSFYGKIDEFRLYGRALSPKEIEFLYKNSLPLFVKNVPPVLTYTEDTPQILQNPIEVITPETNISVTLALSDPSAGQLATSINSTVVPTFSDGRYGAHLAM